MAPQNRAQADNAAAASSGGAKRRAWRYSTTDMILAGIGCALAVGSVLLPWYVFLHQDQFGIRALKFENGDTRAAGGAGISPSSRASAENPPDLADSQPQPTELDAMATGTLQPKTGDNTNPPGLAEQPFPSGTSEFRLIHVANGRALIEDQYGIWLLQAGSFLPDNSRIAVIEERDGHWVVVTNTERVISITR